MCLLVADWTKNSTTAEHVLIDVLNEPDNYGMRWEPSAGKPGKPDVELALHLLVSDLIRNSTMVERPSFDVLSLTSTASDGKHPQEMW